MAELASYYCSTRTAGTVQASIHQWFDRQCQPTLSVDVLFTIDIQTERYVMIFSFLYVPQITSSERPTPPADWSSSSAPWRS